MKPEGIHEIDIQEVISPKQEVEDSNEQNVETCLPRMQLSEKEPCLWRVWIFYVKKGQLKMHIESVNKGIRIMSVDSAIMLPQKSGSWSNILKQCKKNKEPYLWSVWICYLF